MTFALRAEGRQVGDGECFSLADQALSDAGARSAADYTEITPDGDYVWGRSVPASRAVPGDILQFRNFRIIKRVTTTIRYPDGETSSVQNTEVEERDHHTAIVTRNDGTALTVAEQNVEPLGRIVQRNSVNIASATTTENSAGGGLTTTEIIVEGEVRAYHPQLRSANTYAEAALRTDQ